MKFVFCMQINIEFLYKLMLSVQVCATRHAQSIQSKKFAYLCNTSSKAWGTKLVFLACKKIQSFLQVDQPGMPKVLKTISLQCLCNISKKISRMNLVFHLQINVKGLFKLLLSFQVCVCPSMLRLSKITSLLFLCNIFRKN